MDSKTNQLLESINKSLIEINLRLESTEISSESVKLIDDVDNRVKNATSQIH